jgi:cytochrome d ubiquinol oxidase subunit I
LYAATTSCLMLVSGHLQADAVAHNQPCKLAALEAHYETGTGGTEMYLFGLPDEKNKRVNFGVSVPCLLSFLVYQRLDRPVDGLDKFPEENRPPVLIPFLSYHMMAGLGVWFIVLSLTGLFFLWRGKLLENRLLMWAFVLTVLGGYAANETGWVAAEVGRQPWIVYGLLRTSEAVSHTVPSEQIIGSIIMFSVIYAFLFAVWVHVMNDKIHAGPEGIHDQIEPAQAETAVPQKAGNFFKEAGSLKREGEYSLTQSDDDIPEASGRGISGGNASGKTGHG